MMLEELPMVLTVPELARVLRIGKNQAYDLIARRDIGHIRVGRSIRIPRAMLERYLLGGNAVTNWTTRTLHPDDGGPKPQAALEQMLGESEGDPQQRIAFRVRTRPYQRQGTDE